MRLKIEIIDRLKNLMSKEELCWTSTGEFCFTSSQVNNKSYLICRYFDDDKNKNLISLAELENRIYDSCNEVSFEEGFEEYSILNLLYEQVKSKYYIAVFDETKKEYEFELVKVA